MKFFKFLTFSKFKKFAPKKGEVMNNTKKCCGKNKSCKKEIVTSVVFPKESVNELAYRLWEEAGRPESDGVEFWLRAEAELTKGFVLNADVSGN